MSVIKVLYYSDCDFFAGSESMLANIFNSELMARRIIPSFSFRNSAEYVDGLRKRVRRVPELYPINLPLSQERNGRLGNLRHLFSPVIALIGFVKVIAVIRSVKPDLIHVNNGGFPGALSARMATLSAKVMNIPVVMVVNNQAVPYKRLSRFLEFPLDALVSKSVHYFITGSNSASLQLRTVLGLRNDKVRVIHNGISLREPDQAAGSYLAHLGIAKKPKVLFTCIARMEKRKGQHVLLEAVEKLSKVYSPNDFRLILEGEGPEQLSVLRDILRMGIGNYITHITESGNVMNLLNAADVLVLPSTHNEDFPNVILEAMQLTKATVASSIAGIPEQIDPQITGILVKPGDANALARALEYFIANPGKSRTMGQAGKARFEQFFRAESSVLNYASLYEEIIKDRLS